MARLKEIVAFINNTLETKAFKDKRFIAGLHGIATMVEYQGAIVPCIINNDADGKYVGLDDSFSVQVYHKNNGTVSLVVTSSDQFGDGNPVITRRYNMSMMVMGKRKLLDLTPEQLETIIDASFPDQLPAQLRNDFKLNNCSIGFSGTDHNSSTLLKREYGQPDKKYDLEMIIFEMKYTIECIYKKSCIDTLCC
jgi:hypothetical protein